MGKGQGMTLGRLNRSRRSPLQTISAVGVLSPVAIAGATFGGLLEPNIGMAAVAATSGLTAIASIFAMRMAGRVNGLRDTAVITPEDAHVLNEHAMVAIADNNGALVFANRNFLETTGYEQSQLIGRSSFQTYYRSADADVFDEIRRAVNEGRKWVGETCIVARDGSEIWTATTVIPRRNWRGAICGAISIRSDITEIKRAQQHSYTLRAFDDMRDPVAIFDVQTGFIRYLNLAAQELFGWTEADYGRSRIGDVAFEFDRDLVRNEIKRVMKRESERSDFDITLKSVPFTVSLRIVEHDGDHGPQMVAILRDKSHQIEIERVKRDFISTVSHELRTPLTSIKGAMGLALSGAAGRLPDKAKDLIRIAHRNAERLVLLVNDILDLEKIDADKMAFDFQPGNIADTVSDAIAATEAFAEERDITFVLEVPGEPIVATFDEHRMIQVIVNLLSNAVKYSDRGSTVYVRLFADEAGVHIEVADKGVGIPKEAIDRIFDRFQQVNRKRAHDMAGTGLGLAIVKAIMERHGGTVALESAEGEGTTVTCTLPKKDADRAIAEESAA